VILLQVPNGSIHGHTKGKTIIFIGQITIGLIEGIIEEKIENIGDPITSTQWVDSWSHEREGIKKNWFLRNIS